MRYDNPTDRIQFIEYKGKEIMYIDYSDILAKDNNAIIDKLEKLVPTYPKNSILGVINIKNAHYSPAIIRRIKALTKNDKPYIKKSAIIGLDSIKRISLQIIALFSRRSYQIFNNLDDAKEWLVSDD